MKKKQKKQVQSQSEKPSKMLTVDRFIEILKMAKDTDIAPISFWFRNGEMESDAVEMELESVGQMGLLADVNVSFKKSTQPLMMPAVFQRSNQKMADDKMKEIQKDVKKKQKKNAVGA